MLNHEDILRYEEILTVARAAAEIGIRKVRLTGGEPLVRTGLCDLVSMLAEVRGIDDLSLTTNGILLAEHAENLKKAGLKRVNISLDSLQPRRFAEITRVGKLEDVFSGIDAAEAAGLHPVKINVVAMRNINEDEILDFAQKTVDEGWHVRFIEFMPIGSGLRGGMSQFIPVRELAERIEKLGPLQPHRLDGNGPAKYFRLPGAKGTIGFISPVSDHFCFKCNRLRLTAEGKLRPCLLSDEEIDLRSPLREKALVGEIKGLIERAIEAKPRCHKLVAGTTARERNMYQIGG